MQELRVELEVLTRLADRLARSLPRNLDVLQLRYEIQQFVSAAMAEAPRLNGRRRRKDWAAIKRRWRERQRAAKLEAPTNGSGG
jgi:hypothetical protein